LLAEQPMRTRECDNQLVRFARASLGSLLLLATAIGAGCYKPSTVDCGGDFICPPGLACAAPGYCGVPALVGVCQGADKADFDPCDYRQDPERMCPDGECEPCNAADVGCVPGSCLNGICDECNTDRAGCPLPTWTRMTSGTTSILWSVWTASPTEAYVAGGGVRRYDGLGWSTALAGDADDYKSVAGIGSSIGPAPLSVWAVRFTGELSHFDGVSWTPAQLPAGADILTSVWVNRPDDVWAVGFGTVLHFDGTSWQLVSVPGLPSTVKLNAVSGAGEVVTAVGTLGHVIQYANGQWSVQRLPAPYDVIELNSVTHVSVDEAYAVGQKTETEGHASIFHYSNDAWTQVDVVGKISVVDLHGIWSSSATDVIVVGNAGVVGQYDGVEWSEVKLGGAPRLHSVHGTSDVRTVVGDNGAIYRRTL
jgi:hypothetical protein